MNTRSSAVPESFDSQRAEPAVMSATRPMYWSVRRELWENRSIYIAPLGVAGLFLFGFLISLVRLPARMRAAALDPMKQHEAILQPYDMAAMLIMAATFFVGLYYCLEALQGERRDRSILFWKSLPVSDVTTVLSKASIPFVVIPLLNLAIVVATHWTMLLLSTAVLWGNGLSAATLWREVSLFHRSLLLLYHLLSVHVLWHAPIYAWLLLVSAWARRAPLLWAALPLLAIGVFEKIAFNTTHFAALLGHRIAGGSEAVTSAAHGGFPMDLTQLTPGRFLVDPGLWIGLVVAAGFLAEAVRLRRVRGPN